jgi:SAM-dependent methyltransferase
MVEKPVSGARIDAYRHTDAETTSRIHQLYGDSADFDFSPYFDSCGLVFIDGSHAYEYVLADLKTAIKLLKPNGVVLLHDYGIWSGVTQALEEFANNDGLSLCNIAGTSLAYSKLSDGRTGAPPV